MEWTLPVIVLADLPYSHQRFEVLIGLVRVYVVEGAAVSRVPIGRCEVNCHLGQKHTQTHSHSKWPQTGTDANIRKIQMLCERTYRELNLAASHDVIQEGIHFYNLLGENILVHFSSF